jgi:hypothetical protein
MTADPAALIRLFVAIAVSARSRPLRRAASSAAAVICARAGMPASTMRRPRRMLTADTTARIFAPRYVGRHPIEFADLDDDPHGPVGASLFEPVAPRRLSAFRAPPRPQRPVASLQDVLSRLDRALQQAADRSGADLGSETVQDAQARNFAAAVADARRRDAAREASGR